MATVITTLRGDIGIRPAADSDVAAYRALRLEALCEGASVVFDLAIHRRAAGIRSEVVVVDNLSTGREDNINKKAK